MVHEGVEDLIIELVVDFTSKDRLRYESAKRVPRNLVWIDVGSVLVHAVEPLVDAVQGASLVTFIEFVDLRPANRSVSDTLLDYRIEPRDQEVKALALDRILVSSLLSDCLRIRPNQGSLDSTRRFE